MHRDEIPIDVALVRKLVDAQFPDFAQLPLHRLEASGSTNVQFRLGDELLARLPRQPGGSASLIAEQRWVPAIGPELPAAVPEVIALGEPGCGYDEHWAIVRWLEGDLPRAYRPGDPPDPLRIQLARDLAGVILALRQISVPEAAAADERLRHYRGRALADLDSYMQRNIERCRSIEGLNLDLDAARALWDHALTLPGAGEAAADRWYHSDLVAENLLLRKGRLTGVLDFGGLGVGDPTIDLHGAWELFDAPAREVFRKAIDADEAEWLRGRAWALAVALMTFPYYWETMPDRISDRLAMATAVLREVS